jgi:hypothetical protein
VFGLCLEGWAQPDDSRAARSGEGRMPSGPLARGAVYRRCDVAVVTRCCAAWAGGWRDIWLGMGTRRACERVKVRFSARIFEPCNARARMPCKVIHGSRIRLEMRSCACCDAGEEGMATCQTSHLVRESRAVERCVCGGWQTSHGLGHPGRYARFYRPERPQERRAPGPAPPPQPNTTQTNSPSRGRNANARRTTQKTNHLASPVPSSAEGRGAAE